jgi:hypothetical protein
MSKVLTALTLVLALILPAAGLSATSVLAASPASHAAQVTHQVAQGDKPCGKTGYSHGKNCIPVPHGPVNTTICGVHVVGSAQPGSVITFQCLSPLASCAGGSVVSVSIQGVDLNLTAPGARIFKFNPSTGNSTLVSAITGSGGEFSFVFGTCTLSLPSTGGATGLAGSPLTPGSPSMPVLPIGLGLLLVVLGAAMAVRTRKSQV